MISWLPNNVWPIECQVSIYERRKWKKYFELSRVSPDLLSGLHATRCKSSIISRSSEIIIWNLESSILDYGFYNLNIEIQKHTKAYFSRVNKKKNNFILLITLWARIDEDRYIGHCGLCISQVCLSYWHQKQTLFPECCGEMQAISWFSSEIVM